MNKHRRLAIALGTVSIPCGAFAQAKNEPVIVGLVGFGFGSSTGPGAFREELVKQHFGMQMLGQVLLERLWQ